MHDLCRLYTELDHAVAAAGVLKAAGSDGTLSISFDKLRLWRSLADPRALSAQGEAVGEMIADGRPGYLAPIPWIENPSALPVGTKLYTHPAPAQAAHPDDLAADRFAAAMKAKLAAARAKGRGGWDGPDCNADILSRMLRAHIEKGDPRDVANFCCFLWNRGESIQPAPARVTEVGKLAPVAFAGSDGKPAWIHDGNGVGVSTAVPFKTVLYALTLPDGVLVRNGPLGVLATDDEAQAMRLAHVRDADGPPTIVRYLYAGTWRDWNNAGRQSSVALSARAAVPVGFVLVPREPTPNMIESSTGGQNFRTADCETLGDERDLLRRQWAAMLAAAPQPAGDVRIPKPDGDGHCDVCGLAWPNAAETEEAHACPPGFANVVRPAPSAPADVEALATEIAAYYDGKPSCPAEAELQGFEDYPPSWRFSAEKLHEFARRLSGAQQPAKDGA